MSIPATIFLLPFAMFLEKPVPGQWPEVFGTEDATDWQILRQALALESRRRAPCNEEVANIGKHSIYTIYKDV